MIQLWEAQDGHYAVRLSDPGRGSVLKAKFIDPEYVDAVIHSGEDHPLLDDLDGSYEEAATEIESLDLQGLIINKIILR